MSLDKTNYNIAPLSAETVSLFKHPVSLANTCGAADVDLECTVLEWRFEP